MKNLIKISLIMLSIISLMFLSSCSDDSSITGDSVADVVETGDVKEVMIEAFNYGFEQTGDDIVVGDTVKLTVKSTSGIHGVSFPGLGIVVEPLSPDQSKTVEFVATKSGSFDYYCNIMCGPGHMDMRSKLIIG